MESSVWTSDRGFCCRRITTQPGLDEAWGSGFDGRIKKEEVDPRSSAAWG